MRKILIIILVLLGFAANAQNPVVAKYLLTDSAASRTNAANLTLTGRGTGIVEVTDTLQINDYRLPGSNGSAGQIMITDGVGDLTFEDLNVAAVPVDDSNFVVISGENGQKVFQSIDTALLKSRGTEVYIGGIVTINADPTKFDVTEIFGQINSSSGYASINEPAQTAVAVTNIAATSTYVYYDETGTLQQQTSEPTASEWREKLFLARLASNGSQILQAVKLQNPSGQYANNVRDLWRYLDENGIPLRIGLTITGNADLTFARSAGSIFDFGANNDIDEPNTPTFSAVSPAAFFSLKRDATVATGQTNVPVTQYDNAGTLTTLTNNRYVAHRLYFFPSGNIVLQYGQYQYTSLAQAKAQISSENYIVNPANLNGTLLGWWIVLKDATNLQTATDAEFVRYSVGGQSGGAVAEALLAVNNLSDLNNTTTARSNLGVAIGTNVQAYDAELQAISSLANSAGFMYNDGAGNFSYEVLGTMAAQNASAVDITGGAMDGVVIGATTPADGTFTKAEISNGGLFTSLSMYRATSLVNTSIPLEFWFLNSSAIKTRIASISGVQSDNTAGAEQGFLSFRVNNLGAQTEYMRVSNAGVSVTGSVTSSSLTASTLMYANASKQLTSLSDGTSGQMLTTNGAGTYSWVTPATGNVTKIGTPINDQLAVWTGDGTVEGSAILTMTSAELFDIINTSGASASKGLRLRNSTGNRFEAYPRYTGDDIYINHQVNQTGSDDKVIARFSTGSDSGTEPILNWKFAIGSGTTASASRNIWRINNGSNNVLNVLFDGTFEFNGNSITDADILGLIERSTDPSNPTEGESAIWQSDGTGAGDDGDIMIKITAGGVTKTITLVDFSAF